VHRNTPPFRNSGDCDLARVPRKESKLVQTLFSLRDEDMQRLCDRLSDSDHGSSFSTIGSATDSDVSLSSLMESLEDSRAGDVREALTHTTSLLYPEGMPCDRQGEAKVRGTIKALVMQPRLQVMMNAKAASWRCLPRRATASTWPPE
jgi:hypothetical protein